MGVHMVVSPPALNLPPPTATGLAVVKQQHGDSALQDTDTSASDKNAEPDSDTTTQPDRSDDSFAVTIPARSLRELEQLLSARKTDETIDLYHDQGQVVFLRTDQVVTSRTLDGVYPKYNKLIPDTFSRSFTVDRSLLITALERVAVLADQQNSVVKLSVPMADRLISHLR